MILNLFFLFSLIIGGLFLGSTPTFAQILSNRSSSNDIILNRVLFKPPPEDKKPDQTRGAGSRNGGRCSQDGAYSPNALTPLVPPSNFGLTVSERPSLWVMLPQTTAKQIVLSIREEGMIHHSQTIIPITGQSGLIRLQPSEDTPPLETGKTYQWGVVLVCGDTPTPNDPAIAVWLHRVSLSEPINQRSNLEQAAWYAEQGIWYDALTELVQAKQLPSNHQDLDRIWHEFLESGGLEDINSDQLSLIE